MNKKEIKKRLIGLAMTAAHLAALWALWHLAVVAWHVPYDKGVADARAKCAGDVEALYNDIYMSGLKAGYAYKEKGTSPKGFYITNGHEDEPGYWDGMNHREFLRKLVNSK